MRECSRRAPAAHFFFLALPCRADMLDAHLPHAACLRGFACAPPMIKSLLSAAAVLFLFSLAARAEGPLAVVPQSADWTVKYAKTDKDETYTITPPDPHTADFAFSRWTSPGAADQIPGYLQSMAKGFLKQAQLNPKIQLASYDYDRGEFIGFPFSGKFASFSFRNGLRDYLFIFGDSTGLWYGHYIGTPDGWLNAMETLKGIQKSQ
jgi:hypothetical protein